MGFRRALNSVSTAQAEPIQRTAAHYCARILYTLADTDRAATTIDTTRITAIALLLLLASCSGDRATTDGTTVSALRDGAQGTHEWHHYLGDQASNQYSPLDQIDRGNVARLREAWRYDPRDAESFGTLIPTNPLIVKGVLYGLSARKNLFALNAATGEELWVYPFERPVEGGKGAGRGLVYWEGELASGENAAWIVVGLGHELTAVDAVSGKLAQEFGENSVVDLRVGLDRPPEGLNVNVIAPGTMYENLLIQGFGTSEFYGAAPGYIRAYHLPSGELRWTFRTIPAPGEFGADTWPEENRDRLGGANSWGGITVDAERGIAFVPTGSAAFDYYGADRKGDNLFANSLIALNAQTGERLWHYQFVRHDQWDRDLPTPPNLVTVTRNGEAIPAVAQATKSGHLFIFHRETGEPLIPIEEVPVEGEALPGEHPAASQPLPLAPPPFAQQVFQISDIDPASTEYVGEIIDGMTVSAPYHAPTEQGLVVYPGLDGGAEWGGQSWDADGGLLYINTNEVPWFFRMVPTPEMEFDVLNIEFAYSHFCGSCHGANREGVGTIFPSLQNIGERFWPWEVYDIARNGRGRMPGYPDLPWYFLAGPVLYLYTAEDEEIAASAEGGETLGYRNDGFNVLKDEFGLPGSKPPWGSLVAVDVSRGEIAWKKPLGDYPQALARGLSGLGAENYGGPVTTAGGLLFIAATPDSKIRAFDKLSGEVLWEAALPAAGFATPAVYEADGRQFIVIAAGGGKVDQPTGSAYIAYALPQAE